MCLCCGGIIVVGTLREDDDIGGRPISTVLSRLRPGRRRRWVILYRHLSSRSRCSTSSESSSERKRGRARAVRAGCRASGRVSPGRSKAFSSASTPGAGAVAGGVWGQRSPRTLRGRGRSGLARRPPSLRLRLVHVGGLLKHPSNLDDIDDVELEGRAHAPAPGRPCSCGTKPSSR